MVAAGTSPSTTVPAGGSRAAWADVAKGMAIVCVVAYHACLFLTPSGLVRERAADATRLVTLSGAMPLFFALSGLFAQRLLTDPLGTIARRRLLPLLYLYVLWSLVRYVVFQFVPWVLPSSDPSNWREPVAMFLWPNGGLWFLYALALFSLAVALTRSLPRWSVLAPSALLSLVFTTDVVTTGNTGWDKTAANLFWFVLAVHAGRWFRDRAARPRPAATVLLLLVLVSLLFAMTGHHVPGGRLLKVVLGPLTIATAVGAAVLLARWPLVGPVFRFLGEKSLVVYLVHYVPIAAVCGFWAAGADVSDGVVPLVPVVLTVGAVATALVVWLLLRRVPAVFAPPSRWTGTPGTSSGTPETSGTRKG